MKRKTVFAICISLLFISVSLPAQTVKKGFFSKSSSQIKDDKDYGVINIAAEKNTVVLGTIMAYGENVKGLTNIGKDCGKTHFGVEFETLSKQLDKDYKESKNREKLDSFNSQVQSLEKT